MYVEEIKFYSFLDYLSINLDIVHVQIFVRAFRWLQS